MSIQHFVTTLLVLLDCVTAEGFCADKRTDCPTRAQAGCSDPSVALSCPVSCGYCGEGRPVNLTGCKDTDVHCSHWAEDGQCESNAEAMRQNCPTSCGLCTPECPPDQVRNPDPIPNPNPYPNPNPNPNPNPYP